MYEYKLLHVFPYFYLSILFGLLKYTKRIPK